jgi:glycosyltransferase involved in cell wall biosynthesis
VTDFSISYGTVSLMSVIGVQQKSLKGKSMTVGVDVVIPARNEALTVGGIVKSFLGSANCGKIIVIDDGSVDHTKHAALACGAIVIEGPKEGKGQAVKVGLEYVSTETVVFCDADLTGFTSEHAQKLLGPWPVEGVIIGVPDFTPNMPWAHRIKDSEVWGMVSGQRCVPTELVKGLDLHGYAMEVQINRAASKANLPIIMYRLRGVRGLVKPAFYDQRVKDYYRDLEWLKRNPI